MNANINLPHRLAATFVASCLSFAFAQEESNSYAPDFGDPSILQMILSEPKAMVNQTHPNMQVMISAIKTSGKQLDSKELVVFAHPGKNFRVEVTASYKVASPTKLAANLLLEDANILKPDQISELKKHHEYTWHFDSETRQGYKSAQGEGRMTFDLIGIAPTEEGEYQFNLNIGLFDKASFGTQALKVYPVKLVTKLTEATTKNTLFSWVSKDGKEIKAKLLRVDPESIVIDKNGNPFTVPFSKLSAESVKQANDLAVSFDPERERLVLESILKEAAAKKDKGGDDKSGPKAFTGNVYRTILGKWEWSSDESKASIEINGNGTAQMDGETFRWSLSSLGPVILTSKNGLTATISLTSKSSFSGTDFSGKPVSGTKVK